MNYLFSIINNENFIKLIKWLEQAFIPGRAYIKKLFNIEKIKLKKILIKLSATFFECFSSRYIFGKKDGRLRKYLLKT